MYHGTGVLKGTGIGNKPFKASQPQIIPDPLFFSFLIRQTNIQPGKSCLSFLSNGGLLPSLSNITYFASHPLTLLFNPPNPTITGSF